MPSASEAFAQQSQMQAALDSGVEQISLQQNVQFRKYQKYVFAQDGFVFWVATSETTTVSGALHYATDRLQDEDQTIGANQVFLSAENEVTAFNDLSPLTMWIGSWPTSSGDLKIAFAQRGSFFDPANLWHYSGFAVYPVFQAQIVESAADLPVGPITSNSLSIWLATGTFFGQTVPVYPSFLVPDNVVPPYIVAHVDPRGTKAIGAFPIIGAWPGVVVPDSGASPLHYLSSSQLMRDEVDLTLYGFTNAMAIQYLQSLIDSSLADESFGFANSPAIQDDKRTQREITAIAQKKSVHISANYYQGTAEAVAQRLLLQALATVTVQTYGEVYASGAWSLAPMVFAGSGTGYVYGPGAWNLAPITFTGTGTA